MKLLLVIIEGQLYLAAIVAIFIAELAFLLWGLLSRRPIVGLLAVFAILPLLRTTLSAIRACFFRIPAPDGLLLERSEGPGLYDFVEEVRLAVGAPPVHGITLTGGFDASAAVETPSWRFRRRRTLVLGFPVLTTLSLPELRAVVAHELAHFSSAHDGFGAWVYRTRASWLALRTALDRRLATPVYVYWVPRWYEPRLKTASAEVSRRHELVADRVAASVAGSRAAADAFVAFEAGARFAHLPKSASRYGYLHRSRDRQGTNCSVRSSRRWPADSMKDGWNDIGMAGARIVRSISGGQPRSSGWPRSRRRPLTNDSNARASSRPCMVQTMRYRSIGPPQKRGTLREASRPVASFSNERTPPALRLSKPRWIATSVWCRRPARFLRPTTWKQTRNWPRESASGEPAATPRARTSPDNRPLLNLPYGARPSARSSTRAASAPCKRSLTPAASPTRQAPMPSPRRQERSGLTP